MEVIDFTSDFIDGTRLCALVELLQKRKIGPWNKKPTNQHHFFENVTMALNAIAEDEVKLVNIGKIIINIYKIILIQRLKFDLLALSQ